MLNGEGLARVGVRDIGRALDMSPGNLACHFATKDDLVEALVTELCELKLADVPDDFSLAMHYALALVAVRNMLGSRLVC